MRLSVSDKYPEFTRQATQGAQNQSRHHRGTFVGVAPQTKFQPQNLNVWH